MRKLVLFACLSLIAGMAAMAPPANATAPPTDMGDATTDVMLLDTTTIAGATAASSPTSQAHPRSALGDRPADGAIFLANCGKTALTSHGIGDSSGSAAIT